MVRWHRRCSMTTEHSVCARIRAIELHSRRRVQRFFFLLLTPAQRFLRALLTDDQAWKVGAHRDAHRALHRLRVELSHIQLPVHAIASSGIWLGTRISSRDGRIVATVVAARKCRDRALTGGRVVLGGIGGCASAATERCRCL